MKNQFSAWVEKIAREVLLINTAGPLPVPKLLLPLAYIRSLYVAIILSDLIKPVEANPRYRYVPASVYDFVKSCGLTIEHCNRYLIYIRDSFLLGQSACEKMHKLASYTTYVDFKKLFQTFAIVVKRDDIKEGDKADEVIIKSLKHALGVEEMLANKKNGKVEIMKIEGEIENVKEIMETKEATPPCLAVTPLDFKECQAMQPPEKIKKENEEEKFIGKPTKLPPMPDFQVIRSQPIRTTQTNYMAAPMMNMMGFVRPKMLLPIPYFAYSSLPFPMFPNNPAYFPQFGNPPLHR